jgi:hypothetical protein
MRTSTLLDANGTFTVPFFHGTSSLFLPDIYRFGLGGQDVVKENGWVQAFVDLFEFADRQLHDQPLWIDKRHNLLPIVEQGLTRDGNRHNYQHGETYICPEERVAARYGFSEGCELLHYIKNLIHLLQLKTGSLDCLNVLPRPLISILESEYQPLLFQVDGLSFHEVATENGDDKMETLDRYEKIRGTGQTAVDLTSWKLLKPIPVERLSVQQL